MERYAIEQRVFIVEQYFKNNECLAAVVRKFHTKYGRNSVLTSSTVKRLIEKFRETGSVGDAKHTGRPKTSRSNVNIEAVRASVGDNPWTSIRRRGQELQISRSSLQRILTKDLCLHAYKIQLTQLLKPNELEASQKEYKNIRLMHSRKTSRVNTNTDILHWLCINSDPLISEHRPVKKKNNEKF